VKGKMNKLKNKYLIYTLAVNTKDRDVDDHGIFDTTKKSWTHYCNRHGIDFHVIDKDLTNKGTPHWLRYCIFDQKPGYDKYLYVDSDIMVHWNAPNIFEKYPENKLHVVRDNSGLGWIWESINLYRKLFEDVSLDWERYFNSGVMMFSKDQYDLIDGFKNFYLQNIDTITEFQKQVRKGFDQTPFNYFNAFNNTDINYMSERFNLTHMMRKEVLQGNYFVDMAWFWHFNGIPRDTQQNIISQLWDKIKVQYE
tara:strand:- start:120 stop:875 length:756 start_codon:yes stop_codon:yes gene_type:complete